MGNTTNVTIKVTYDCPYRNICSDNGKKCGTCRHNPRRSYYESVEPHYPYYPYYPYPYYPYWYHSTITWNIDAANNVSHYQSI